MGLKPNNFYGVRQYWIESSHRGRILAEKTKALRQRGELDELDHRLLDLVRVDGRISNNSLAQQLGIAPSTAHARLASLVDRGVITGFTASVNQTSIGLSLQAIIGVTLRPGARRESIERFSGDVRKLPQVIELFFLGGADDFIVHVAVPDISALREFVVMHLSGHASVASTRTSIVFDYHRNETASSFQ